MSKTMSLKVAALRRCRNSFTMIELLIVVGVIAILASLLFPALATARESARKLCCLSNLRQIGQATYSYAGDSNEYLAPQNPSDTSSDPFTNSIYTGAIPKHGLEDTPERARGLGLLVRGNYLPIMTHYSDPAHKFSVILMCPTERNKNKRDFPCRYASDLEGRDLYVLFSSYWYFGGFKYTNAFVLSNQGKREPRARITDWPGACIARDGDVYTHGKLDNVLYLDGHVLSRQCGNYVDFCNGYRTRPFED